MATSPQALARLQIQTIAVSVFNALSFDSTRIKLGLHDVSDNVEFLATLQSGGPYLMILPAKTERFNSTDVIMPFSVDCQLWYGTGNDSDFDFTAAEDLLYAPGTSLIKKVADFTQYSSTTPILEVEVGEPEIRSDLTPMVILYPFTAYFKGTN